MRTKRVLVLVVMILTFSATCGAQVRQFKDVDPGHWAYDAIKQLVDAGIIPVFEDGTFRGNDSVDRYTLASVIAAAIEKAAKDPTGLTEEDLVLLKRLSTEFREDLVRWYEDRQALLDRMESVEKLTVSLDESINQSLLGIHALDNRTVELKERIERELVTKGQLEEELTVISTTVASLLVEFSQETQLVDKIQQDVALLQDNAVAMGVSTSDLQGGLEKLNVQQQQYADDVQKALNRLEGLMGTLTEENTGLATRLGLSESDLASLNSQVDSIQADVTSLRDSVKEMSWRISELEERSLEMDLNLSQLDDLMQKEIEDRQRQILELTDGLGELRELLGRNAEETAAILGELQVNLYTLEDVVGVLQPDLSSQLSGTRDELKKMLDAQSKSLEEHNKVLDTVQKTLSTHGLSLGEHKQTLLALQDLLATHGSLLEQQDAALTNLQQVTSQLQGEIDKIEEALSERDQVLAALQEYTGAQQAALSQQEKLLGELTDRFNLLADDHQRLTERQANAEATLTQRLVALEDSITALQREDERINKGLLEHQSALSDQGAKLADLEGQLGVLKQELAETRLELGLLGTDFEDGQSSITTKLEVISQKYDVLESDLQSLLADHQKLDSNVSSNLETMERRRIQELAGSEAKLQMEIKGLSSRVEDLGTQIEYLNTNLAEEVAAHVSGYRISESQLVDKLENLTQQFTSYRQTSNAHVEALEGKVKTMQLVAVLSLIIALIK